MAVVMALWLNLKSVMFSKRMRLSTQKALLGLPKRLYRAIPAVLLGVLFNTLDAVSTGLLVFPSKEKSASLGSLQLQAMSMYIMSTIMSQIAMTLGGSLFPGALGSMLIEVLPFLRGIATDIQDEIGDRHPSLIPTVLATYALTSFLVATAFTCLAIFRCGRLVEYFPQTVLTGAIGAIGMSLFVLALELTLPSGAAVLTMHSAKDVLFTSQHVPLLMASFLPALFLTMSIRLSSLEKASFGFTQHALFVPVYLLVIVAVFWIVVAGSGLANTSGIHDLSSQGWLFTVEIKNSHESSLVSAWNYWTYFDFSLVRWSAIGKATENIVLLVVIGVLNLPIYIPAMALSLDVPVYNMNHELFGHGISNFLAGAVGTVPNLVVFTNTRFFTLAGGRRFEASIVILITIGLYFVSSLLLPYVPTIVASTMVLFLGIELMADALWESSKKMTWYEWTVIFGTFLACTFVGFAPGFGVGLALATLVQVMLTAADSRVHMFELSQREVLHGCQPSVGAPYGRVSQDDNEVEGRLLGVQNTSSPTGPWHDICDDSTGLEDMPRWNLRGTQREITVLTLSGHVFFAMIPSLERRMRPIFKLEPRPILIVDLTKVHRLETSVVQYLERKSREIAPQSFSASMILAGVVQDSSVHSDLKRGGIACSWIDYISSDSLPHRSEKAESRVMTPAFETLRDASQWAKTFQYSEHNVSDETIVNAFCRLLTQDLLDLLFSHLPGPSLIPIQRLQKLGIRVKRPAAGEILAHKGLKLQDAFIIVRGRMKIDNASKISTSLSRASRPSLRAAMLSILGNALQRSKPFLRQTRCASDRLDEMAVTVSTESNAEKHLLPGDTVGLIDCADSGRGLHSVTVIAEPCWILEVDRANEAAMAWLIKARTIFRNQREREREMLSYS